MLLAAGLLIEFASFLQILSWIILPVLLCAIITTVILHYRRKKRLAIESAATLDDLLFPGDTDEDAAEKKGPYVFLDHTGLIKQYQQKLSYHQAKYVALSHDFAKLESQYKAVLPRPTPDLSTHKTISMDNINEQTNTDNVLPGTPEYLADLLQEKNAQISFLQSQLESRVRSFHQLEQNRKEVLAQLETLKAEQHSIQTNLQEADNFKEEQQRKLNVLEQRLHDAELQLEEKKQMLVSRLDQATYLENILSEIRQQNELLNAEVADLQEKALVAAAQLSMEETRAVTAEERLAANKQMLQRLFKEFSSCVQDELAPPVVTLRPAYINQAEWDETAVQ